MIFGKPANAKGALAKKILELNRGQLRERREERLEALNNLANRYAQEPDGELKRLLRRELLKEISNGKEYAFVARAFLRLCCDIEYENN